MSGCPPHLLPTLSQKLSFADPQKSYAAYRGGYPAPRLYMFDKQTGAFPSGLTQRVVAFLSLQGLGCQVVNLTPPVARQHSQFPDWLLPFQVNAVEHMFQHPHGTVQSPTGSGKTVIAGVFLSQVEGKSLMVVPSKDLLYQTHTALETLLEEEIGMIGDGRGSWRRVTVGIINSLDKLVEKKDEQLLEVRTVIYDEAHHATQLNRYGKVSQALSNAYYRVGLTAGAHREQGDDLALEGIIGPTLLTIPEDDVIALGRIIKPEIFFVQVPDPLCEYPGKVNGVYPTPNGKPELSEVYRLAIVENKQRNRTICDLCGIYLIKAKAPGLILVESLEHGQILQDMIEQHWNRKVPFVHGNSGKVRKEVLEALKSNEIKLAIATRIYNEGVDIKNLELVIIASAGRSRQRLRQQIGRAVRSYPGKTQAIVIDFADQEHNYLSAQANARIREANIIYKNAVRVVKSTDVVKHLCASKTLV